MNKISKAKATGVATGAFIERCLAAGIVAEAERIHLTRHEARAILKLMGARTV